MVVVGLSNGIRVGFEYALHFELHLAAPLITSRIGPVGLSV